MKTDKSMLSNLSDAQKSIIIKRGRIRNVLFMTSFILVAFLIMLVIRVSNAPIYDSTNSNLGFEDDFVEPSVETYIPIEYLEFKCDDGDETAIFTGINSSFINQMSNYKTLYIPSKLEKVVDGATKTYQVNVIDIAYPQSIIAGSTTGNFPNDYAAYQETTAYLGSEVTSLIIPSSIKTIEAYSFFGFASLEYLNTPFIGVERLTQNSSGGTINQKNGTLGIMFGEEEKTTKFKNYSGTIKESTEQIWLQSIAGDNKATFFVPSQLKRVVVTCEDYIKGDSQASVIKMDYLASRAFYSNPSIETIIIGKPEKTKVLPTIGAAVFSYMPNLKNVELNLDSVGDFNPNAFSLSENLERVVLPTRLSTIPNATFSSCKKLKEIVMPTSLDSIGEGAFFACESLPADFVTSNYLPSSLSSIGNAAFKGCTTLTTVSLGNTVTEIGRGAFYGCFAIQNMTIPFVGKEAGSFYLTNNPMPSGDENAINEYVEKQQANLFTWIFTSTFTNSANDQGYTIDNRNFYHIYQEWDDGEVLEAYIPNNLTSLTITNETGLSRGSLTYLKSLTSLSINEAVIVLEEGLLFGCSNLTSLTVSSAGKEVNAGAVYGNHIGRLFGRQPSTGYDNNIYYTTGTGNGTYYLFPKSLNTLTITNQGWIQSTTLTNLTSLKKLTISEATTRIDTGTLYNASALEELVLPFAGEYAGGSDADYVPPSYNYSSHWYWWAYSEIRNSIVWIFANARSNADMFYQVNTFYGYTHTGYIRYVPKTLKSVTLTNETVISSYAFRNLISLENVTIKATDGDIIQRIGDGTFSGCSALQELYLPFIGRDNLGNNTGYSYSHYTLGYLFGTGNYTGAYKAEQLGITYYLPKNLTLIDVKNSNGFITNSAFKNATSLQTIHISFDTIISAVGDYAFYNCNNLSVLTLGKTYNPETIGNYAFYGCILIDDIDYVTTANTKKLGAYSFAYTGINSEEGTEINLSRFSEIGNYAFAGCQNIESIKLPTRDTTELGEGLFANCYYLHKVVLKPDMLTPYMFKNCVSLTEMDISSITDEVPEGVFQGCSGLKNVVLSPNTTVIGAYAFEDCVGLGSFIIPNKVTTIEDGAFKGCTGFVDIIIPLSVTKIGSNVFDGCNKHFVIYVYIPEEEWPAGWSDNWNCFFPVYILGYQGEDIFIYEEVKSDEDQFIGWRIIGVKDGYQLGEVVAIPGMRHGLPVIEIGDNALKNQLNVKEIIVTDYLKKIGTGAFLNGNEIKLWSNSYQDDLTNGTYDPAGKDTNFMKGMIFYKGTWEQVGVHPRVLVSALHYELTNTDLIYNGNAQYAQIAKITTDAVLVGVTEQIEYPLSYITTRYFNTINAGTATIEIKPVSEELGGIHEINYTIAKKKLFVAIGEETGVEDIFNGGTTYSLETTYTGNAWTNSQWDNSNIIGLEDYMIVTGTLATNDVNVAIYMSFDLVWADSPVIRHKTTGQVITNNFEIAVDKQTVQITRANVILKWPEKEKIEINDQFYNAYNYNGEIVEPKPEVYYADNPDVKLNVQEGDLLYNYPNPSLWNVDDYGQVSVSAGPNIIIAPDQETIYYYAIVKGKIEIIIDNYQYKVRPDEVYWTYEFGSGSLPSYITITGMGPNTTLEGTLKSVDFELPGNYTFAGGTIFWVGESNNEDFNIIRNQENENAKYDVIVNVSLEIVFNDFTYEFYMITQDANPDTMEGYEPIDFVRDAYGNLALFNGRPYMEYEADGDPHAFVVVITNETVINPVIGYHYGTGETQQTPNFYTKILEDGKGYSHGFVLTGDRYNTYRQDEFYIFYKKSTVKIDDDFTKEYDAKPFDPFANGNILKYGKNQTIEFKYYAWDDTALLRPLAEAPTNVGKYRIQLIISDTDEYFLPITDHYTKENNDVYTMEIKPRRILIDTVIDNSLSKMYDGGVWSLEFNNDLINKINPTAILPGDNISFILETSSAEIGTYRGGNLLVKLLTISNTNGEIRTGCYEIIIDIEVEITPRQFIYTADGYSDFYDGNSHSITVNVTEPANPDDYTIYYRLDGQWSTFNIAVFDVGTYEVFFMLEGEHYETIIDSRIIEIKPLEITYTVKNDRNETLYLNENGLYYVYANNNYNGYEYYVYVDGLVPVFTDVKYAFGGEFETGFDFSKYPGDSAFDSDFVKISEPGQFIVWIKLSYFNYKTEYIPVLIDIIGSAQIDDKLKDVAVNYDPDNSKLQHGVDVKYYLDNGYKVFYSSENPSYMYYFGNRYIYENHYGALDLTDWQTAAITYSQIGEYYVYIKIVKDGYAPLIKKVKITIYDEWYNVPLEDLEGITFKDYNAPYDGKYHSTTIIGLDDYIKEYDKEVKIYYTTDSTAVGFPESNAWTWAKMDYKKLPVSLDDFGFINAGQYRLYVMIKIPGYNPYFSPVEVVNPDPVNNPNPDIIINDEDAIVINITQCELIGELVTTEVEYTKKRIEDDAIETITYDKDGGSNFPIPHDGVRIVNFYSVDEKGNKVGNPLVDPEPFDLGFYYVEVIYFATSNCKRVTIGGVIEIVKRVIRMDFEPTVEYDSAVHFPNITYDTGTDDVFEYEVYAIDGPTTTVLLENGTYIQAPIEIGTYTIGVRMISMGSNLDYYELEFTEIVFEITTRKVNIEFEINYPYDGGNPANITLEELLDINSGYLTETQINDIKQKLMVNKYMQDTDGSFILDENGDYMPFPTGDYFSGSIKTISGQEGIYTYLTGKDTINTITESLCVKRDVDGTTIDVPYYEFVFKVKITIERAPVDVTIEDKVVYYDGTQHSLDVIVNSHYTSLIKLFAESEDSENLVPYLGYTEVGKYEIFYYVSAYGFRSVTGSAVLTILPADLEIEIEKKEKIYDGYVMPTEFTINNILQNVESVKSRANIYYFDATQVEYVNLVKLFSDFNEFNPQYEIFEKYRIDTEYLKDAGNYYVVVYFAAAKNWNASFAIETNTIEQREIIVEFNPAKYYEFDYNGMYRYINLVNVASIQTGNVAETDMFDDSKETLMNNRLRTTSKNAGIYSEDGDFAFDPIGIFEKGTNRYVGFNYKPVVSGLTIKINKINLPDELFYADENQTKEYTGLPIYPDVYKPEGSGELSYEIWRVDPNNPTFIYEKVSDAINVGTYKFEIMIGEGQNYFASDKVLTVYLTITKAKVKVIWENMEKEYDGKYTPPTAYFKNSLGERIDLDISFNEPYQGIAAGEYLVNAYPKDATLYNNYDFSNAESIYTVLRKKYTLEIIGTKEYDGTAWVQDITAESFEEEFLPNHTFSGTIETRTGDIGTYIDGLYIEGSPYASSGIYDFIWKPEIYVYVTDAEGNPIYITNDNDEQEQLRVLVSYSFDIEFTGRVTIDGDRIQHSVLEDEVYPYDGTEHGIELRVLFPTRGYTVKYWYRTSEEGEEIYSETEPKFINIGLYFIRYEITATNTNIKVEGETTLEIIKGHSTFTIENDLNKEYDGLSPISGKIDYKGVYNGTEDDLIWELYYLGDSRYGDGILIDKFSNGISSTSDKDYSVGFYKLVVTSGADFVTEGEHNYEPLYFEKVIEIRTKNVDVSIKKHLYVSTDPADFNANTGIYEEGSELTIGDKVSFTIGSTLLYDVRYNLVFSALNRGEYSYHLNLRELDVELADNLIFSWVLQSDGQDLTGDELYEKARNFAINLTIDIDVTYQEIIFDPVEDLIVEWDGTEKYREVNVTKPTNYNIRYSANGSDFQSERFTQTEPGILVVYFELSATNYETYVGSYTINVTKATRKNTELDDATAITKEYDGLTFDSKKFPQIIDGEIYPSSATATDKNPAVTWKFMIGGYNGKLVENPVDHVAEGYYVSVILAETEHYKETVLYTMAYINQRKITITGAESKIYDGNAWFMSTTITNNIKFDGLLEGHYLRTSFKTNSANVGVYHDADMVWENITNKYEITSINGDINYTNNYYCAFEDIEITINKANIKYQITNVNEPYYADIKKVTIEVFNPANGYTITYSETEDGNYTTTPISRMDVGETIFYVKIDAGDNYNIAGPIECSITIYKATIEIENISDLSKEFDGNSVGFPRVTMMDDHFVYDEKSYIYTFKDKNRNTIVSGTIEEIQNSNLRPKNAGIYYIEVTIPSSETYFGTQKEVMFTISAIVTNVTWGETVFIYDGTQKIPEAIIGQHEDDEDKIIYDYIIEPINLGDINSIQPGKYRVTLNQDEIGNYIIENNTIEYEILRREITISLEGVFPYTGSVYKFTYDKTGVGGGTSFTVSNIPENHTFVGSFMTISAAAGNHVVNSDVPSSSKFEDIFEWETTPHLTNGSNIDVLNTCIDIKYDIQITINNSNVQVTQNPVDVIYDGKAYSAYVTSDAENIIILYSKSKNGTYSEIAPEYVHVNFNSDGEVIPYYTYYKVISTIDDSLLVEGVVTVTINKADPNVDFERGFIHFEYNGAEAQMPTFTYDEQDKQPRLPELEIWIADADGNFDLTETPLNSLETIKNVGKYKVKFTLSGRYQDYYDYLDYSREFEFEIYQRKITINIGEQSKVYNGAPWEMAILNSMVERLLPDHYFSGTLATAGHDAKLYVEKSDFFWKNTEWRIMSGQNDLTSNYDLVITGSVEILKADIEYVAKDTIVDYDGEAHTISIEVTYPDESEVTITYGTEYGVYSDEKVYRITGRTTVYYVIDAGPNFNKVESYNRIIINPLDGEISDVNFPSKVYDGDPVGAPTYVTPSQGAVTITYYYASDVDRLNPLPGAPTNAGEYVGRISIAEYGQYGAIEREGNFTISKRDLEIVWGDETSFVYDGFEHCPTATATGVKGEVIDLTIRDARILVGNYIAVAETTNQNYNITNKECPFEITKKVLDLPVFPPDQEFETGDDINIKDEEGNEYVVDEDGNVTEIIHPDGSVTENPDLDFDIVIKPNEDGTGGTAEIVPKDPENTTVPGDKVEVDYIIKPKPVTDPKKELRIELEGYMFLYTGEPITPEVKVWYLEITTNELGEEEVNEILLVYGEDYLLEYSDNIDPTNAAKVRVYANEDELEKPRYLFDVIEYFQIVEDIPKILTLKVDSVMQFVTMAADYDANTRTFEVDERTVANQENMYLGHLAQGATIQMYLDMIANDLENIRVYDQNGYLVDESEYETKALGTNWSIALEDDYGNELDRAYCILFGDCDGNGQVNANDSQALLNHFNNPDLELKELYNYSVTFEGAYNPSANEYQALLNHFAGTDGFVLNGEYMFW